MLQVAPPAVQEAPRGRSVYRWCTSRCEILLSTVLSSLTLVVMLLSLENWMLLSLFHLEREAWANTPWHTCEMFRCLVFLLFYYSPIYHHLPALAKPQTSFGQWTETSRARVAQTFLMKSTSSCSPFQKDRGRWQQISQLKKTCC